MILEPKIVDSYQCFLSVFHFYYQRPYKLFLVMRIRIVVYSFSGTVTIHGSRLSIWTRSFTSSPLNAFKTYVFIISVLELVQHLVCLLDPKSSIFFNTSSLSTSQNNLEIGNLTWKWRQVTHLFFSSLSIVFSSTIIKFSHLILWEIEYLWCI